MQTIVETKTSGFMCIDWDDQNPFVTYGKESQPNFQGIEVIATPCNFIHEPNYGMKDNDGTKDTISEECIKDPEQ